jgi:hypothetical protein
VPDQRVRLVAEVSSDRLEAVRPVLEQLIQGTVSATPSGLHVEGWMLGAEPRELNRQLLSALRRVERKTRLRAEWDSGGVTHRFFDYVLKSSRPTLPTDPTI